MQRHFIQCKVFQNPLPMCTHTHTRPYIQNLPTHCTLQAWYDQADTTSMAYPDLPHDSKDRCIFHSTDRKWKAKNNCGERFSELFQVMATDESIDTMDFREVVLTGFELGAAAEMLEGAAMEGETCILLGGVETTKAIRFQGARFLDKLVICDLACSESVDFDQAVFKDVVTIERCQFESYVSFIGGCRFDHNVVIEQCYFGEVASFDEAVFMQQLCLTDVHFASGAAFQQARQLADDLICQFTHVLFDGYTSFSNGGFNSSVTFDTCRFGAETHFENTVFRQRLQLIEPAISEKIFFICTRPGAKLFENAVDIELAEDSFSPVGQIIFQNANLFNLNPAFKEILLKLEMNHRIEIREGCLLYRTSTERIFDYSALGQFLVEDLARIFTRFFETRHHRSLKMDIFRDLQLEKVRVVFHTDEAMSIPELEALLQNAQKEMLEFMVLPQQQPNANYTPLMKDHLMQMQGIWQRMFVAQYLPLLEQFFANANTEKMEEIRKLLNVTLHIHVKNAVIGSQITAGSGIVIGDKN